MQLGDDHLARSCSWHQICLDPHSLFSHSHGHHGFQMMITHCPGNFCAGPASLVPSARMACALDVAALLIKVWRKGEQVFPQELSCNGAHTQASFQWDQRAEDVGSLCLLNSAVRKKEGGTRHIEGIGKWLLYLNLVMLPILQGCKWSVTSIIKKHLSHFKLVLHY